jgi:DNA-binding XRE family transcriptional regulator
MAREQLLRLQDVRKVLGRSQAELAELLGASVRAVQSYEQGWRPCPPYVQKLSGLLLLLHYSHGRRLKPCYRVMKCPAQVQETCPGKNLGDGQLCWMVTGTHCRGKKQKNWQTKIAACLKCPVIAPWLPA